LPKGSRNAGILDEAGFEVGEVFARGHRIGSETIDIMVVDDVTANGAELENEAMEERALG